MDEEDRYTRITLRIPKDLHAQLSLLADDTSKSLNAQIVACITAGLGAPGAMQELAAAVQRMTEENSALEADARFFKSRVLDLQDQRRELQVLNERRRLKVREIAQRESRRIDADRVRRLMSRLISIGFRRLADAPQPQTLNHPDVVLATAVIEKLGSETESLVALLSDVPADDTTRHAIVRVFTGPEPMLPARPAPEADD